MSAVKAINQGLEWIGGVALIIRILIVDNMKHDNEKKRGLNGINAEPSTFSRCRPNNIRNINEISSRVMGPGQCLCLLLRNLDEWFLRRPAF